MPIVCRRIPNRTRPRYFRACDAARIAREVIKDDPETTPEEVLACIAKGMGFTHISLSRPRVVEASVSLKKSTIISLLKIAKKLIEVAQGRFGFLRKFLLPALKAIDSLIEIIDALDFFDPSSAKVDDVINKEKCKCRDQPKQETAKKVGKK